MPMTLEKKLAKQGWQKQATYDEPRLSEMAETYRELGFEVHLEPFNPENEPGCTGCMKLTPVLFKTIYTRKTKDDRRMVEPLRSVSFEK